MTIPGAGGQVPPRPDQQGAGQPVGVVVAPGAGTIVRAREVIISGPGAGLWIYNVAGKLIVSAVQSAGTDPKNGQPELAGVSAYIYDGSGNQLAVSLSSPVSSSPAVTFENPAAPGVSPPAVFGNQQAATGGAFNQLVLNSGDDTGAGTSSLVLEADSIGGAITITAAGNITLTPNGGTLTISGATTITATGAAVSAFSFTAANAIAAGTNLFVGSGGAGQGNINLNPQMGSPVNYPTSGKTLAQTQACLDQLIGEFVNRGMIA